MDKLLEIRISLDEAITYQSMEEARDIALKGLKVAQEKECLGEVEYFKGQLQILKENYRGAIEHFDRAIEINPADGASYNDRALCMVELGIIDEALDYFDKGIEAEPDYATIYHNKGWLLNKIGRHTEAIDCFNEALKLDPNRPVTYENLADAFFNLFDYRKALEAYNKALNLLKPQHFHIREHLIKEIDKVRAKLHTGT